jgi:hypothetical protein
MNQHETLTHRSYVAMINSCRPNGEEGRQGITVHPRWYKSFACFVEDMGLRPAKHKLVRKYPDQNYFPGNCEWVPDLWSSK